MRGSRGAGHGLRWLATPGIMRLIGAIALFCGAAPSMAQTDACVLDGAEMDFGQHIQLQPGGISSRGGVHQPGGTRCGGLDRARARAVLQRPAPPPRVAIF